METCRFFDLARGRRISTIPSLEYDADDARCFFIDDAVGRRPPARARDAARRTPRTERMMSSVASSVTTARCAYAASPVRRSTEVREFCARRFSDARRATRARATRRRRARRATTTTMGMRRHPRRRARGGFAGAANARRRARAAKRGGIILSARCAAAEGGGRARCARGRARRSTSPWRRPPYPFTRRGRRRAMRRARTAREGRRCGEMVEGNLRARGRRARTAREGRDD